MIDALLHIGLLVTLLLTPALHATESNDDLAGQWLGGYDSGGGWVVMRVHLQREANGWKGAVDLPGLGIAATPLQDLEVAEPTAEVRFRLAIETVTIAFAGRLHDFTITGTADRSGSRAAFQMYRFEPADRASLTSYVGTYRWDADHYLYVQFWGELGPDQIAVFDESGLVRSLWRMGPDRFFVGQEAGFPVPFQATITFQRQPDGTLTALLWSEPNAPARAAQRVTIDRSDDVVFRNGQTTLAGTLITPATAGRHPAMVIVHGSGAQDRNASLPFVRFLVRHGIALLAYDKRGVGGSSSDWRRTSFDDLAGDAVAAVRFLETRSDIDSRRIGVFGVSQGGWIGPLTASRSKAVAFVISVSGPGVSPAEETLGYLKNEMTAAGLPAEDVAEAEALAKAAFSYARTGKGWTRYLALRRKSAEKSWFPYMDLSDNKGDWQWEFRRLNNDYDPSRALKQLRCPVLAFFGERDLNVVAGKNSNIWKSALANGGHDRSVIVLPGANHVLMESATGSSFEFPHLKTFVPEYQRILVEWVNRHVLR
jgi:pimeloyl-ACP methyl ester carboxylesterase